MQLSWGPVANGVSGSCMKLWTTAMVSYGDSACEESAGKLVPLAVRRSQSLTDYWTEASVSSGSRATWTSPQDNSRQGSWLSSEQLSETARAGTQGGSHHLFII